MIRAAALLSLACLSISSAHGQSSTPTPNIAGLWTFEADVTSACSFNGQARLMPGDDAEVYDCELTARQDCPSFGVRYTVEQSCSASVDDGELTIFSTIVNFLEGEPSANYLPDHFRLTIKDSSSMEGVLIGSGAYPAIWRRAEGAIS